MRHKLLFQLIVTTALAKSSSKKRPKQGEIKHPTKRKSAYVVTPNTTRVVVLKMPHSGSTWFAALLNRFPRTFVREESITKTRSNNVNPEAIRRHVGTSLARPTDKMVASRNGKHAYSPRAKHFDCGGCELAVLGLTMCPMKSEAPYDFPAGVTAAVFRQTIPFKTIFWARTNVVKMVFASNGSKDRKGKFVRSRPPCDEFARTLGYKAAQLRSLDALYDERRRVDASRVLKVRYEALQANEKGTLGRVARFLGVEERQLLKAATFVGEKRTSEDLRDVVANYNELHTWLAPGGVLASPCLLRMLEAPAPAVFALCPLPALVERTLNNSRAARTCPGPPPTRGRRIRGVDVGATPPGHRII